MFYKILYGTVLVDHHQGLLHALDFSKSRWKKIQANHANNNDG